MKTIVCEAPLALTVEERPRPVRQPGEVLLRIRRIGICGTDYHIFDGTQPYLSYPRVMGHELAGIVAECDPHASVAVGQVVTVNPYLACGTCIACRKHKPNCCTRIRVLGVHIDGGMCEYLTVPETAIVPVGNLTLDQAAMVEFLAVGAHAVRRGSVTAADDVLVIGAGPIGVGVALFAGLAGARVTLLDTSVPRLNYAHDAVGIERVLAVDAETDERLAAQTAGEYFDCVYDATGNIAAMRGGLAYVAHGGRYVLVSVVKGDLVFADPEFHKRETTLLGSRNATSEDFRHVIDRIAAGAIPTDALLTHRFPAEEAALRFPELIAMHGDVLKAIATF